MSRAQPSTVRTVLVLLVAASILGWLPRLRRSGSIRAHVELLRNVAPIQQFAPAAAQRAFAGRTDGFDLTIVVHRARTDLPFEFVPIDERAVAAWLA